ncbi:MAG TPA: hypothetical protein VK674_06265 [Candidatus Limnocylindria bacterium]|nr:hypothetical protein [Candidatus Limnocylindria bacterium]
MTKKGSPTPSGLVQDDPDVEERVRQMMDPAVSDPKPIVKKIEASEAATAPEVTELPVPDKPLRIKILKEGDTADASAAGEPSSAPELTVDSPPETVDPKESDESPPRSAPKTEQKGGEAEPPEDQDTAKAVDDIVRHEGDELLAAEDAKRSGSPKPPEKHTFRGRLKAALADLWKNPRKRKLVIATLVGLGLILAVVPTSRYFVLNTVGVRASASVRVLDESTLQPLRNVEVTVRGVSARTDDTGTARLEKVKLGPARLQIKRRAFAPVERGVTIGWGSNPLGEEKLRPTGTQYAFLVTDFFSARGITKAEATSGEASAFSDEAGKLLLTLEDPADEVAITVTAEGRRNESFKINADGMDERPVRMVPGRKHAYISRRAGRYDVYAAYADGKEETLMLKGTGHERSDLVLVPHPTENLAALVSTRAGNRNGDGYLLSDLTIIDLRTKSTEAVQSSERIQLTGWFGDRLVYVRVVSGASAADPHRSRLMAYHYKDDTNNELAASNYFNDVLPVGDRIYYAPSGAYQNGVNVSLFSIKPDNTDRQVTLNKEVWNIFRTAYDKLVLSAANDEWYDYLVGQAKPAKLSGEPANLASRVYTSSPTGDQSLWVDNRDGKGVLVVYDTKTKKDKTLRSQTGLKNPISWLNENTIVYRVKTDTETADYAMSIDGGQPRKIADVTNSNGLDRWYYY